MDSGLGTAWGKVSLPERGTPMPKRGLLQSQRATSKNGVQDHC